MSERERWIVYPLLFLALGAALRDKLFDMTTSKRIVCQELLVVDEDPATARTVRPLARIGRVEGASPDGESVGHLYVGGQVEVNGPVVARQFREFPNGSGILSIDPRELWRAIQQSAQQAAQGMSSDANPADESTSTPPDENGATATESNSNEPPAEGKTPE